MPHAREKSPKQPLVLIAERDREHRTWLRQLLEQQGFEVLDTNQGKELLQRLGPRTNLVLLGSDLEDPGPAELCEAVHNRYAGDVPVVVLRDSGDVEAAKCMQRAVATDLIDKTTEPDLLIYRIRSLIGAALELAVARHESGRLRDLQRIAGLASFEVSLEDGALAASPEARSMFGLPQRKESLSFAHLCERVDPVDRAHFAAAWESMLDTHEPFAVEHRLVDSDAGGIVVSSRAELVQEPGREPQVVRGASVSIGTQTAINSPRDPAFYDKLTGLATRALFEGALRKVIDQASHRGGSFAVLHIGLDGLRKINDAFGRFAGDSVLRQIAHRLLYSVRTGDWVTQVSNAISLPTPARLSGDEFALLLPELRGSDAPRRAARRIIDEIAQPIAAGGRDVIVTACVGISVGPEDGMEVDGLLLNAVEAMQGAKREGRSHCQYWAESRNREAYAAVVLESKLQSALENNALDLHYQPKVEAQSGRICGVEALLRWNDPELGPIPPDRFVALAEQADLIVPMGLWVMRQASQRVVAWREEGIANFRIAVNVSPRQFSRTDFVESILSAVNESGATPEDFELEITEGCLLDGDASVATLTKLKEHGFSIAIDDFGTGYSSLQYLRDLPIDCIKIDRVFIKDVVEDERARSLTLAMISIAWGLGLRVVAEGVEEQEQWSLLRDHGCDEIQGYCFSKPKPAAEFENMLRNQQAEWQQESEKVTDA